MRQDSPGPARYLARRFQMAHASHPPCGFACEILNSVTRIGSRQAAKRMTSTQVHRKRGAAGFAGPAARGAPSRALQASAARVRSPRASSSSRTPEEATPATSSKKYRREDRPAPAPAPRAASSSITAHPGPRPLTGFTQWTNNQPDRTHARNGRNPMATSSPGGRASHRVRNSSAASGRAAAPARRDPAAHGNYPGPVRVVGLPDRERAGAAPRCRAPKRK